jgi:hypothetical protein
MKTYGDEEHIDQDDEFFSDVEIPLYNKDE